MSEFCPICSTKGSLLCSACLAVSYCSVTHQKKDWNNHKNACKAFKVIDDSELGQQVVASRCLKAGTILWDETAAYSSPAYFGVKMEDVGGVSICVTCGLHIDTVKKFRCSTCSWPICGIDCEHNEIHSKNECEVFAADGVEYPPDNFSPIEITCCILMIRAAGLKKRLPEKYDELLNSIDIKSELNSVDECADQMDKLQSVIPSLKKENAEDQSKLLRLFKMKGIMTQIYGENINWPTVSSLMCVFPQVSRLSHSCAPNCTWAVTSFPDCNIRIRTAVPVKAGQPLTITFFIKEHSYGTYFRQKNMLQRTSLVCKCRRCLDPTELETYMSAFTCRVCRASYIAIGNEKQSYCGYLLPENPLDMGEDAIWRCNQCDTSVSASDVIPKVETIYELMKTKEKEVRKAKVHVSQDLERIYSNIIQQCEELSLHPNHWILQEATRGILKYDSSLFEIDSNLDFGQLSRCVSNYEYLLNIENIVSPGISLNRACIQRHIAQAIILKLNLPEPGPGDLEMELEYCRECQKEAYTFYASRLPGTSEISSVQSMLVQDLRTEMHLAGCPNDDINQQSAKVLCQKAAVIAYLYNYSTSA